MHTAKCKAACVTLDGQSFEISAGTGTKMPLFPMYGTELAVDSGMMMLKMSP